MQSRFDMTGSWISIWLAHTAYGLPFCNLPSANFLAELPKELLEAARIDGHSEFSIFCKIVILFGTRYCISWNLPICVGMERSHECPVLLQNPKSFRLRWRCKGS